MAPNSVLITSVFPRDEMNHLHNKHTRDLTCYGFSLGSSGNHVMNI